MHRHVVLSLSIGTRSAAYTPDFPVRRGVRPIQIVLTGTVAVASFAMNRPHAAVA